MFTAYPSDPEKVIFYCHFPDKMLAPKGGGLLRRAYRLHFDRWEEATIRAADKVLVNSRFTAQKFGQAFSSIKRVPEVLYPTISTAALEGPQDGSKLKRALEGRQVLLSVNRFERKKHVQLALGALLWLRQRIEPNAFARISLILAGGYDNRVVENKDYLQHLQQFCTDNDLAFTTIWPGDSKLETATTVIFMPSISDSQKAWLLHRSLCLLYTPPEEHFGITPLEAMFCGIPVVSVNSGGPRETIMHGSTGFLCDETDPAFGQAIAKLLEDKRLAERMGQAGSERVATAFSLTAFREKLDSVAWSMVKTTLGN